MLINETEFGAPWNDQCYIVTFYLTITFGDILFKSSELHIEICLRGPKKYSEIELEEYAQTAIIEEYKDLFEYDNFIVHILNIS